MTCKGDCYTFRKACHKLRLKHVHTKPYSVIDTGLRSARGHGISSIDRNRLRRHQVTVAVPCPASGKHSGRGKARGEGQSSAFGQATFAALMVIVGYGSWPIPMPTPPGLKVILESLDGAGRPRAFSVQRHLNADSVPHARLESGSDCDLNTGRIWPQSA